jgi:isocitrate dehydrogenase
MKIVDAAVAAVSKGTRKIHWLEAFAGNKAVAKFGTPLPEETLKLIEEYRVGIKGPLATPTGGGMRSLNVALRKKFDLYQCIRPVRGLKNVPSPVLRPQDLNVTIFRENTEDVYSGIEFEKDSEKAQALIALLKTWGVEVREDSGLGIKPISEFGSKRLIRKAIQYAVDHERTIVTIVAKGNIMKFTEGAFMKWGFEMAKAEFGDRIVTEDELKTVHNWKMPEGKILLKYRIADAMFMEMLVRPTDHQVIATMNLNGDYLSDLAAAIAGGLGVAPGANIGDLYAIFEAIHGTADDIAGQGKANPTSLLLSAVMMLEYIGWQDAADAVMEALEKTFAAKTVTGDLARFMEGATMLGTSAFADAVIANLSTGPAVTAVDCNCQKAEASKPAEETKPAAETPATPTPAATKSDK